MSSPSLQLSAALVLTSFGIVFCSWGDTSATYKSCLGDCSRENCSQPSDLAVWREGQPVLDAIVGWTCKDDCGYVCMWKTTDVLERRFNKVPQFHGRWPFIRLLGLQEPASVLFSVLNLLSHLFMVNWFIKLVPDTAPMYRVWFFYSLVSMNAWVWSTVFHARDTPLTEMLDYFCAFSTVLCSLLAFVLRAITAVQDLLPRAVIVVAFLGFYVNHVISMATVKFDYGYNMKVNVIVGGLNCVCWLVWFWIHRRTGDHVRKGTMAILALTLSVCLELVEFTPLLWSVDSHALWHLVTAPLPILWYQFAAGDCLLLIHQAGPSKLPNSNLKKNI